MSEGRDNGFTLIEVIVALAILAGAAAVTYRGLGYSWRLERAGTRAAVALRVAETELASIGAGTPLADGQLFSGVEAGVSWQARVEQRLPTDGSGTGQQPAAVAAAYWIVLDAQWQDATARAPRTLRLRTLKFGPPP